MAWRICACTPALEILHNVALLPYDAVQLGQQGSYVYVVQEDQSVAIQAVKISEQRGGNMIPVLEGLSDG